LSPLATLSRGYSISKRESDGGIINSIKQTQVGDNITLQLTDGILRTTVDGINENT